MTKGKKIINRRGFKAIILVGLIIIMAGFVAAWEFDNVKSYDSVKKEVTISNMFGLGGELARVTLLTDLNQRVGLGYQKVAEYQIDCKGDYNEAIKTLELYNLKDGLAISRDITYKYKVSKEVSVDDYETKCSEGINKNGTKETTCERIVIGSHKVIQDSWENLDSMNIKEGKVTIGLFTDVQKGDYIEWIPNLFGVKVSEWASWTADLNTNLMAYYSFEEGSGTTSDNVAGTEYDLASSGTPHWTASGIIGNAIDLEKGESEYFYNNSGDFTLNGTYTINLWTYRESGTAWDGMIGKTANTVNGQRLFAMRVYAETDKFIFNKGFESGTAQILSYPFNNSVWYMLTLVSNTTGFAAYKNGAYLEYVPNTDLAIITGNNPFIIGGYHESGSVQYFYDGIIDEVGIWTRQLTDAEVTQLYNGGVGMTYTNSFPPTVTLNTPVDNANFTVSTVVFNCSATTAATLANITLMLNGVANTTNTTVYNNSETRFTLVLADGNYNWSCNAMDTDSATATATYRNFTVDTVAPLLSIDTPTNTSYNNATQWVNITSDSTNQTIWYNYNGTNYTWTTAGTVVFPEGLTTLKVWANDSLNNVNYTSVTFFIDSVVPLLSIISPTATYYTTQNILLNISSDGDNTWYNWNGTNYTYTSAETITFAEGNNTLSAWTNDTVNINYTNVTFTVDTTTPNATIISPISPVNYGYSGVNVTLNFTANDGSLSMCWYDYNNTNTTVTCSNGVPASTVVTTNGQTNISLWMNDTAGNVGYSFITWVYSVYLNSETYNSSVYSGDTALFTLNLTMNKTATLGQLIYNGTSYAGTIYDDNYPIVIINRSLTVPYTATQVNRTFDWNVTLSDLNVSKIDTHNQTVKVINIDNCGANTEVLYNFSIADEGTQVEINETAINTTGRVNMQIYNSARTILIKNYSAEYNDTNPFAICLDTNFSTGGSFKFDVQVEYSATGYSVELYHVQDTLNSSKFPINVTLLDLNSSDTQKFKIIYKDSSFLPVADALITIQRKYIDEGVFKTVEVPKTDYNGEVIGNLVVNDVIYNFIVSKYGTILGTFSNMKVVCQTPLVTECVITLNSLATTIPITNQTIDDDFYYEISHNNNTRTTTADFTVLSGIPAVILMNVTKSDALGTSVCSETVTTNAGSLTCISPVSIGNGTIVIKLFKDGNLVGTGMISLAKNPQQIYGGMVVFLGLFIMMSLIGLAMSDNPVFTVLFLMVGVILLFSLNLVASNGFIGGGATILFIIMAIIIVVIKGGKRQ